MEDVLIRETKIRFKELRPGERYAASLDVVFHAYDDKLQLPDVTICVSESEYRVVFPYAAQYKLDVADDPRLRKFILEEFEQAARLADLFPKTGEMFLAWESGKILCDDQHPFTLSHRDYQILRRLGEESERGRREQIRLARVRVEFTHADDGGGRRAALRLMMQTDKGETLILDNVTIAVQQTMVRIDFPSVDNGDDGTASRYDLALNTDLHQLIFSSFDDYLNSHYTEMKHTYMLFNAWAESPQQGKFRYLRDVAQSKREIYLTRADYDRLHQPDATAETRLIPDDADNPMQEFEGFQLQVGKLYLKGRRIADIYCYTQTPFGEVKIGPFVVRCFQGAYSVDITQSGVVFLISEDQKGFESFILQTLESYFKRQCHHPGIADLYTKLLKWKRKVTLDQPPDTADILTTLG